MHFVRGKSEDTGKESLKSGNCQGPRASEKEAQKQHKKTETH